MKFPATITLKKFSEGGRRGPIYSGYRPTVRIHGVSHYVGAVIWFMHHERIEPGNRAKVEVEILFPDGLPKFLMFDITEGDKVIGWGVKNIS